VLTVGSVPGSASGAQQRWWCQSHLFNACLMFINENSSFGRSGGG
jgi:hypothetical protein